jgi:hypothetical protein
MCTWAHLARAHAGKAPYGCVGMSQAAKKAAEKAATEAAKNAPAEVRAMPVCLWMRCASSARMHHVAVLHDKTRFCAQCIARLRMQSGTLLVLGVAL